MAGEIPTKAQAQHRGLRREILRMPPHVIILVNTTFAALLPHRRLWSRSRMDTTNASGALDPGSIPGGTTILVSIASSASIRGHLLVKVIRFLMQRISEHLT